MKLSARQREGTGRCPFCHDFLGPPELVQACPACSAVYHRPCARDLARCATLGCEGLAPPDPVTVTVTPRERVARAEDGREPTHVEAPLPTWREAAARVRRRTAARNLALCGAAAAFVLLSDALGAGIGLPLSGIALVWFLVHTRARLRQREP